MDLDGMAALVTGGADGIGAGIAERLAAEGMHVLIADLDENAGQETAVRIGGSFIRADVATEAGVRTAIDTACRLPGRVGVLVNNAGGFEDPCFPAADTAKWEYTLNLNLRAVMLATQLILAPMAEGGGAIINIASVAGLGTTSHDSPEYAVAKAGVIRFTACLAPLRETMGVRANCICPDMVDTPASRRSRARMTPAELATLRPVLTPADIAAAAMEFLADDAYAGRTMVCRGGEPNHLLPLIDWQTALARLVLRAHLPGELAICGIIGSHDSNCRCPRAMTSAYASAPRGASPVSDHGEASPVTSTSLYHFAYSAHPRIDRISDSKVVTGYAKSVPVLGIPCSRAVSILQWPPLCCVPPCPVWAPIPSWLRPDKISNSPVGAPLQAIPLPKITANPPTRVHDREDFIPDVNNSSYRYKKLTLKNKSS
jgi:NAD(P)-dependent dehydrogenase (short-subunit alcohol dehydrogenase family)